MHPIFAHHAMLESFDVLHLNPVTPAQHALAFGAYAAIVTILCHAALAGYRLLKGRLGSASPFGPRAARLTSPLEAPH